MKYTLNYKFTSLLILITSFILIAHYSTGQSENLIENGSFESVKGKLKGLGAIENAVNWYSPTPTKADLFIQSDKIPFVSTSANKFGKEEPKQGDNYAGIVSFSFKEKMQRSYLSTHFSSPLVKGMKYCVSMHASLAEASMYASNKLAIHFSKKEFSLSKSEAIIAGNHILHPLEKVINSTYGWEKICGVYTAEGGEKFITIGNFSQNTNVKNEKTLKNKTFTGQQIIASYFYIDDIQVRLMSPKVNCDCFEKTETSKDPIYHKIILLEDHLTPIQRIEAHTTFFSYGQYRLQEVNKSTLDVVISELKKNPTFNIHFFGHTDENENKMAESKPSFADLPHRRIKSVIDYFIENGIEADRLFSNPIGSSEPNEEILADDDDELKMAKNRRVMFKVIIK